VSVDPHTDRLVGYDARTGERRFARPTDPYPAPVLAEGVVVHHATADGDRTRLAALDADSGTEQWTTPARDYWTPVVAAGDRVFTRHGGVVRSRSAADGSVAWRTDVPGPSPVTALQPVWIRDGVYVGVERRDEPDRLLVLDPADGSRRWRRTVGAELEGVAPAADGVFVASSVNDPDGGILIRLDGFDRDGTRRWQTTTELQIGGAIQTLARVGEAVVAASDTAVAAYDPADGTRRWRFEPESYRLGVAVGDDALYVSYRSAGGVARLPIG
jgi:outer membrane protein assembly factor BamB